MKTRSKKENKNATLVSVVYIPHNTNINVFREHMLNILQANLKLEIKNHYIMGEYNYNLLNYDHHTETRDYVDTVFSNAFFTYNHNAYQDNTNHSYINIQYLQQRHTQMQGIIDTDISDQLLIFLLTKLKNNT